MSKSRKASKVKQMPPADAEKVFRGWARQPEPMTGEFWIDITTGSDHQMVLGFAAMIETNLKNAIRIKLPRMMGFYSGFFLETPGPLSSLLVLARFAYVHNIIDKEHVLDLEKIALIRNTFAHATRWCNFLIPEVKAYCDTLILPDRLVGPSAETKADPRLRFFNTASRINEFIRDGHWHENVVLAP